MNKIKPSYTEENIVDLKDVPQSFVDLMFEKAIAEYLLLKSELKAIDKKSLKIIDYLYKTNRIR